MLSKLIQLVRRRKKSQGINEGICMPADSALTEEQSDHKDKSTEGKRFYISTGSVAIDLMYAPVTQKELIISNAISRLVNVYGNNKKHCN